MLTSDEGRYARHDADEVTRSEIDDFDVDPTSAAEGMACAEVCLNRGGHQSS
jgi:hypothetical protein